MNHAGKNQAVPSSGRGHIHDAFLFRSRFLDLDCFGFTICIAFYLFPSFIQNDARRTFIRGIEKCFFWITFQSAADIRQYHDGEFQTFARVNGHQRNRIRRGDFCLRYRQFMPAIPLDEIQEVGQLGMLSNS